MVGHILLERLWLVRYFSKLEGLDDDQVREKLNSMSMVKREVFRYACYNGKSKGVMRVVLPILAVAWVLVLAALAVLAGVFVGLGVVWFHVSGKWMHYKRSKMTPEARAAELTRMEDEALRSIAESKDDPAFLTSQHPADRAYRELTLKTEEIIHKVRQKKAEDATSAQHADFGTPQTPRLVDHPRPHRSGCPLRRPLRRAGLWMEDCDVVLGLLNGTAGLPEQRDQSFGSGLVCLNLTYDRLPPTSSRSSSGSIIRLGSICEMDF